MPAFLDQANREALRVVLDGIGDGVILTGIEGNIIYINEAAAGILDYNCTDAVGRPFGTVCPLQYLPTQSLVGNPVLFAMRRGQAVGFMRDTGIVRRDGRMVYLSATCSPIRTQEGMVRGCSIIMRDVTQVHSLELQLEEERRTLKILFTAAGVGMCILDEQGAIVEVNEAGLDILQAGRDMVSGMQFGDAFHCENSLESGCGHGHSCPVCPIRGNIERAIADERYSGSFTVLMRRIDASQNKPVWIKIFISQARTGCERRIVLALADISERKAREVELEKARQEAERASRAKGQFLANMSHEIRTPINGMLGMINLTLHTGLTQEQQDNLQNARQCSEDLLRIINDILDFSKLESGRMELEEIRYDLHELLMRVVHVHEKVARSKGLVLFRYFPFHLPHYIVGDPLRLRQILHNLLSNAIKFTMEGTIHLQVNYMAREGHGRLEFSIRDTGIGMKAEDMKRLFQPFSQVDGSTTRRFGGTGLGLMIVRELVQAMGGDIRVESQPGRGSSFIFFIPCTETSGADAAIRDQSVFVKPVDAARVERLAVQEDSDADIADLLEYCEDKLKK